ncbi:tyrosine-type recombinase/integrase [Fluviispira multicolorata]|uniref:Tyrosine-type recombinase/integrase n=1 Tax=Fluviispira multicolorata TaxID=2654512 RepID=A0A833JG22_9BACT|nr:tyrosine-type recombinase/integrase [Fluviispira multicolorata]KAB8033708.1 tyrosine-type recombinase/integrase [Fluviispira multicolorata]
MLKNKEIMSLENEYKYSCNDDEYFGKDINEKVSWFLASFRSVNTRKSYERDIREFFLFCFLQLKIKVIDFHQVTERIVLLWKHSISQLKASSIRRKLSALSSLFNFLIRRKFMHKNIIELIIKDPVSRDGKTNVLTHDEVIQLLNYIYLKCSEFQQKNNLFYRKWRLRYVILYTLLTVGMRVEELCQLKIKSLEFNGEIWKLHMIAKGDLNHSPIIHPATAAVLIEYLKEFRADASQAEPLFIKTQMSKNITKLSRSSVFRMVKICAEAAGLKKEISPHSCRTTLASLLHQNGIPIIEIKNLLNHKLVTTTEIYIKNSNEHMKSEIKKMDIFE